MIWTKSRLFFRPNNFSIPNNFHHSSHKSTEYQDRKSRTCHFKKKQIQIHPRTEFYRPTYKQNLDVSEKFQNKYPLQNFNFVRGNLSRMAFPSISVIAAGFILYCERIFYIKSVLFKKEKKHNCLGN